MADDENNAAADAGTGAPDPGAAHLALAAAGSAEARAVLEKQAELLDLQIAAARRSDRLAHLSSRVRQLSDVMRLAFQFAVALIALALAAAIGATVWTAAHDEGLVIEAFNVPADFTAKGLTGEVVATQIQDRLAWMQSKTDTIRAAGTFRHDWGHDIKVQIPETGVSVGEVYRTLAEALGRRTHISGEIYRGPRGLTIATRDGNDGAGVFAGKDSGLDALIEKAAEHIYHRTQPYRYIIFLEGQRRTAEAEAHLRALALSGPAEEQPWAYTRWGLMLLNQGDVRGALEKQNAALARDPTLSHVWANRAGTQADLGHDEAAFSNLNQSIALLKKPEAGYQLAPYAVKAYLLVAEIAAAQYLGDYQSALAMEAELAGTARYSESGRAARVSRSYDFARAHDIAASRAWDSGAVSNEETSLQLFLGLDSTAFVPQLPGFARAAAMGDWKAARDDLAALERLPAASAPALKPLMPVAVWPWHALAHARLGDFAAAHALIAKTPADCYLCLRVRGGIRAAEGKWDAAAWWFARAARAAPSLPFAETEWGQMLLARGDTEAAIAKFAQAHAKGPRFADALALWGEALMKQNRSDLALAKFAEANRYAPKWGRLHLKWAEALYWSGDKIGARKRLAAAASLYMSAAGREELRQMQSVIGRA